MTGHQVAEISDLSKLLMLMISTCRTPDISDCRLLYPAAVAIDNVPKPGLGTSKKGKRPRKNARICGGKGEKLHFQS